MESKYNTCIELYSLPVKGRSFSGVEMCRNSSLDYFEGDAYNNLRHSFRHFISAMIWYFFAENLLPYLSPGVRPHHGIVKSWK